MDRPSPASVRAAAFGEVPFEFLAAKLRGRRSKLFEGDRLRELVRLRSVEDLIFRLYPREDIRDAADLERTILRECVAELAGFARYVGGAYGRLYRALIDFYPVENLKVLWRLFGPDDPTAAPDGPRRQGELVELPDAFEAQLRQVPTFGRPREFAAAIPMPAVRAAALEALSVYEETRRKGYLEMAFDRGYWTEVVAALAVLRHADREDCAAPVLAELDSMRLLGTVRAAETYGMSWDEWSRFLPPDAGSIGRPALQAMHGAPEPAEAAAALPWVDADAYDIEKWDVGTLEEELWHRTVRMANRQYYKTTSGPAVLVSYFYLKREETRHLLALVQFLRYGTPEAEVVAQLGLT
jgi:vacuolar-type H+-ATPase subunit C/Vma6